MSSAILYLGLVLAGVLERVAELVVSQRHIRWAMARGGVESGRGHYPAMVALQVGLGAGSVVEVFVLDRPFVPALGWSMLAVVLASQALRWWCIATLGQRWSTRVVVIPGLPLVKGGPYRWLRHPNYIAVAAEGIAFPLVHSAWITALCFTLLNSMVLTVRIRTEDRALAAAAM